MGAGEITPADLPRSFFVVSKDPRRAGRHLVDSILSDGFMAVLAVLLVPVILLPLFVALPASVLGFLGVGDVIVVAFFVIEYVAKLYLSEGRWAHFRSPWRLLDLAVVVVSVISYLPLLGLTLHGSWPLLLRLLRLPRAFAVGARVVGRATHEQGRPVASREAAVPETIDSLTPGAKAPGSRLTWEEVAPHVLNPSPEWIDIEGIGRAGIHRLSELLKIPEPHFKSKDIDNVSPHVHRAERATFLFLHSGEVSFPTSEEEFLSVDRSGLVIICAGPTILTISPHHLDVPRRTRSWLPSEVPPGQYLSGVLYAIFSSTLDQYRHILSDIEADLNKIGKLPRERLPRDFLERMYAMRREMARVNSSLVHMKDMLIRIDGGRLPLDGFDEEALQNFRVLQGDTEFLGELSDDITDSIQMDVDLYINQEAFETNKMLKVLAVITGLSLIPAVLGGVLGMNLLGQPYPLEMWQVVGGMALTVAFLIYCFIKAGWLKT
ncbi:MAG: ion transporter [Euryarchaeota archaeon]|nr:ion transporter [Euryarchaeota archaeon]MDE1836048.1 ion transporter [Euryarchaeota archaeon]MDE1881220.1 ion transporter [Euryarchaeota archaeon]MDE2044026.1 ion transporter [Thermoplasmata archaeon]